MSQVTTIPTDDFERRLRRLAQDKANIHLIMNLMTSLASVQGLENTIDTMFRIVLEHVGGTNLSIHYRIDAGVFYADILGERKQLAAIVDPLVGRVFETGEFLEHEHDFGDTKMTTPQFTHASTWVFPLKVGLELIGVFKIESMHILARDLRPYLPTFFSYAALLLKNEILGYTHLSKAYALLEKEVEARKCAEEELLKAKTGLEVTIEKRTAELRHLNRLYDVLSHVNQATVLAASREALCAEVCGIAVDLGGFHLAWIGWVNWDTLEVTPSAGAGPQIEYMSRLRLTVRDCPEGRGPSGTAIREGMPSVTNDLLADPRMAPWRESALKAGFRSSAAVPIFLGGRVAGVICVYGAEKDLFRAKEISLLEEVAAAVSMGLNRIEADAARKKTDAALRASEKRFRALFDNSPVPIWEEDLSDVKRLLDDLQSQGIVNLDGFFTEHPEVLRRCTQLVRITEVNHAAVRLHEASSKEDLLSGLAAVFAPESYATFQHAVLSLWRGETPLQADGTLQTLRGAERHVTLYWSVVPGHEHTLSRVLVSVIDITERKMTERQLTLLDFALDHVREAAFLIDVNAHFHYVNDEACRVLGYTRDELLKLCVVHVDPDFAMKNWATHWEDLKARHSLVFESRHMTKEGRLLPVEVSANFFEYEGRGYNLALVRDITDREIARSALQEKERELRTLVDNLPECVARFDTNGRHVFVNRNVETTFDAPREFFIGKTLAELGVPSDEAQNKVLESKIREALIQGVPNSLEIEWATINGARQYDVLHVPEVDETGKVISVLGIAHDITLRKESEREHLTHLRYFESMDRVNRSIQGANTLEELMSNVLDDALSIMGADRASLCYPCDPNAESWRVPIERTRPEYPGLLELGIDIPMLPEAKRVFNALLAAEGPVPFGPEAAEPLPEAIAKDFTIQSQLGMAVYPKVDSPYMFVLHQCSHPRVWSAEDKRLFQEIGRRLGDGLTSLLTYRDLRKSE